jgi:hypothetical protein
MNGSRGRKDDTKCTHNLRPNDSIDDCHLPLLDSARGSSRPFHGICQDRVNALLPPHDNLERPLSIIHSLFRDNRLLLTVASFSDA